MAAPKSGHILLLATLLALVILAASGATVPGSRLKTIGNFKTGAEFLSRALDKYKEQNKSGFAIDSVEKGESRVVGGRTQYKYTISVKPTGAFARRCKKIFTLWYEGAIKTSPPSKLKQCP